MMEVLVEVSCLLLRPQDVQHLAVLWQAFRTVRVILSIVLKTLLVVRVATEEVNRGQFQLVVAA